ncbi:MAG: aminotransferase class V-fold PLP-dependent enzyme [Gemmatimonadales bacterium]
MASTTRRGFVAGLAGASLGAGVLHGLPRLRPPLPAAPRGPGRFDEPDWERLRGEFLPGQRTISLNSANMSPAPKSVVAALDQATRHVDADVSYQSRARFGEAKERVRERLSAMLGARPDELAIVRNASEANNIVVAGLDLRPDDEVLLFEQNHPTNNVAWEVRAARMGFAVRRISLPANPKSPAELLDRFASAVGPRTRVIGFSHVSNVSGLRIPAAELCQWARARNIYTHVDGAQTFAAMRIDLGALGADSFAASTQKWLMGPREMGLLFVRESRLREVWPGVVGAGWGNEVTPAVVGARRFETMGQRDDAATAGLEAALGFHATVGPDRIFARTAELSARIADGLAALGLPMVTPRSPEVSLAVRIIDVEPKRAAEWHERLYRDHGVISSPTGGLRFSPCVAVTLADVDRALEAIGRVTGRA